ncbi:MAG: putative glycoside hydrolase [Anaerolineales bacterium]|nr:putative glycoside hydrolase [Anaerolineales bacterium]
MKRIIPFLIAFLIVSCAPAAPSAPTLSSGPTFPRLGMWWPNPYEQPLEKIARYDWVILDEWASDFVDPLRALKPDIRLLTATNACELDFNPDTPYENDALKNIPYQWYLTQVGSTLSEDVDSAQTVLPVEAVTVQGAEGEIDLFVAGDSALIEGESVYIESVDKINRRLVVERGYVRPASAHAAGVRIAAHISFWPHSWTLNVSVLSPTGIADPAIGAERWADYNARIGAQALADPRWDGILVDRSDANESWLIGHSTARSIDPDQSNQLLGDYSAFDESWNEGLRSYLDQLRAAVGQEKIIFLNWGIPYYAAVNGNNFEGFPDDSNFRSWRAQTFGPSDAGSYFDWMEKSRQPNLTRIETYEDDSSPDAGDSDGYPNRCNDSSFTPNYRKMRFGLATALLNDGYFSYEMNTEGHGSLCLMWFDEYDNAGAGRGYLGYPLGAARQVAEELNAPNLIESPVELLSAWNIWSDGGYNFVAHLDADSPQAGGASARLDISEAQGEDWRASFSYAPVALTQGMDYTLTFSARADSPRSISAWVQQDQDPWKTLLTYGNFNLTTGWQTFEAPSTSQGSDEKASLTFGVGQTTGAVWLGNISLRAGNGDVWRRDFEHGIVLVNATSQPVVVSLEGKFVKIDGAQDRTVNDGATVSKVTLPPNDGIILLRK